MKNAYPIIAACDLSEYSKEVLACAAELAENLQIQLIVINVINKKDIDAIEFAVGKVAVTNKTLSSNEFINEMENQRRNALKALLAETGITLSSVIKIRRGVPFEELITAAKELKARFIVIGAKGSSNIATLLLGSTAERMLRLCPVPLISVRLKKNSRTFERN